MGSPSLVRRMFRRDKRLPEMERLWVAVGGFFFSSARGDSSSIFGNGMAESISLDSEADVLMVARVNERHGDQTTRHENELVLLVA